MDEAKLREMWFDHAFSFRDIRKALGMTLEEMRLAVRRLRLPARDRDDSEVMTPEQMRQWDEIVAARKAEVQSRWTPREEYMHRVIKAPEPYTVPHVQY